MYLPRELHKCPHRWGSPQALNRQQWGIYHNTDLPCVAQSNSYRPNTFDTLAVKHLISQWALLEKESNFQYKIFIFVIHQVKRSKKKASSLKTQQVEFEDFACSGKTVWQNNGTTWQVFSYVLGWCNKSKYEKNNQPSKTHLPIKAARCGVKAPNTVVSGLWVDIILSNCFQGQALSLKQNGF